MIGGIGLPEILIILLLVVLLFGAKKLPEIGGGLGRAIKNFKKATDEPDEIDITANNNQQSDKDKEEGPKA